MKTYVKLSAFLLLIIFFPFINADLDDDIKPIELTNEAVGYYQSTTCKISLSEFFFTNLNSDLTIFYNINNYADINCFGKITGLDKVDETFIVSIGTNTSINLLLQSLIWIIFILLIPKMDGLLRRQNLIYPLAVSSIFTLHLFFETRFYDRTNILFDSELSISNFYLIASFLNFFLISMIIFDIFEKRIFNFTNYLPFVFLVVGTYSGMNINILLIIGTSFGIKSLIENLKFNFFDYLYFFSSFFWLSNINENNFFFDGDKLRGFTNSSYTTGSQISWIIIFYLSIKGYFFIFEKSNKYFNIKLFSKNLIFSSSLIVLIGYLGAIFPIINFFNFYIFGQNKRGMKEVTSVAGNAWRGASPSAEAIGEFFGFVLLIFLIQLFKDKLKLNSIYLLLPVVIFGLLRSNNFAAASSLALLSVLVYLNHKDFFNISKKNLLRLFIFLIFLILVGLLILDFDYQYLSTELLYEATLHHDFYSDENTYKSYLQVQQKMIERDLGTILRNQDNLENASTTYVFLVNLFTQNINIPFFPNIVAVVSTLGMLINRTEMWGIFIAKYSPNMIDAIFGNGPMQLNKYLYDHKIRLDVPEYKLNSLFLPHSSFLDIQIFFGILGLIAVLGLLFTQLRKSSLNNIFFIPSIYLFINFLKSDSLMYIHSFILFLFCFYMVGKLDIQVDE